MHLNAVATAHMLWHRRREQNEGFSIRPHQGLTPALQGERCHLDLQPSERVISTQCQTSKNICVHHFKSEHETTGYH